MTTQPAGGESRRILTAEGLRKKFGQTVALRDASLELLAGEVHALVGENGSGKSTLVKILAGVHRPDAGSMTVADRGFSPRSPGKALRTGVDTVFQEVLGVENRSVLDNLWLGADGLLRPVSREGDRRARAEEVLAELLETPPPLDVPFGALELSDRQACCIARSLLRDPQVLILDEATSALDYDTRTRLFGIVGRRAEQGMSIVLITHRMDEIDEVADRVTVLRSGQTVATLDAAAGWDHDEMIRLMTGAEHLVSDAVRAARGSDLEESPVVLRVNGSRLHRDGAPCHAEFRRGEIVGLAGLEGHGQDEFLRLLLGHGDVAGVSRVVSGAEHRVDSPRRARDLRIAYVARDRRGESILPWMSVLDNFAIATARKDVVAGLLSQRRAEARFRNYADRLHIKHGRLGDAITTLSGGNQQKVVIARWLASDPEILLLNDPTRGIDVGAKRDLYELLAELSAAGLTVIMLSSEVEEHVELMDRVLVFREGSLAAELGRAELSQENLVEAFFGGTRRTA